MFRLNAQHVRIFQSFICTCLLFPLDCSVLTGRKVLQEESPLGGDPFAAQPLAGEAVSSSADQVVALESEPRSITITKDAPLNRIADGQTLDSKEISNRLYNQHVQPAVDMAHKHFVPQLVKHSAQVHQLKNSTKQLLNEAHGRVTAHLTRLMGQEEAAEVPEWMKTTAYGLLLFPLGIWVLLLAYFFTQMAMAGILFTLAKCGNLFWTIYCFFLSVMTFVISDEPLFFFHQNHPSEYIAFQFVKAGLFFLHLVVLLIQCMSDISFLNVVQWVGSTLIGVHYYLNAWHPAMKEEPPLLGFKYYAFYMYCFFIFFILPSSGYRYKYRED